MYKFVVSQGNNGAVVREALEARGCWSEASESEARDLKAHLIWKQLVLPIRSLLLLESNIENGFPPAIHNHLDNNREITTKPGLIRSLRAYYQTMNLAVHSNYHAWDSMGTSFIITAACEDLEYHSLVTRYTELQSGCSTKERMPSKHCRENIWLIKPAALNQGRGIEICHSLKEIKSIIAGKLPNSVWVVQKYIEKPLLFQGRKFDIRVWALATARKELFFYKNGYLRTSSFEYSTGAKDNYIHLTNNCLQKWGENYGAHESGNTLSFEAFQDYLSATFPALNLSVCDHFLPRMKDLIIDSFLSAKKVIHGFKRRNAFELLGYDFLIDEDFRVWLIEANTNPYLGVPNEYIGNLLPVMLDDMLSIAVDPYYPPAVQRKRTDNDFELLYCEVSSQWARDGTGKNLRRPFTAPLYPVPALAQIPMYRENSTSLCGKDDESDGKKPPSVVKDTFSTLKEMLDSQSSFDVSDFVVITARILSHLQNWELSEKEQIASGLQALRLLCGLPRNLSLCVTSHFGTLLSLVQSENIPTHIQEGIIDSLIIGCGETRFKRELVQAKALFTLIPLLLTAKSDCGLLSKQLSLMFAVGKHPAKTFYIPGETREHCLIREMFISQGGLTCLYQLSQTSTEESVRNDVRQHLNCEFGLADWHTEVKTIAKVLKQSEKDLNRTPEPQSDASILAENTGKNALRKGNSPDLSFSTKDKREKAQFPAVLMNTETLVRMKREIEESCEAKRVEIGRKQAEEARKKEADNDEKLRQREEEDRVNEDRRQKAEQELLKRYSDRKQKKLEALRKQVHEKALEDRLDEERRQALLDRIRKQEESRRYERMRKRQELEEFRRQEDEKQRAMGERRRVALNEWLRMKDELEKERRTKDRLLRECEEARRIEELNQRRSEIQEKLGERHTKKPKSDIVKSVSVPPDQSTAGPDEFFGRRTGKLERILEEPRSQRTALELTEGKGTQKSQPPVKKRQLPPGGQFLFEVYGNIPLGKKKKSSKLAMSKHEPVHEGSKKIFPNT